MKFKAYKVVSEDTVDNINDVVESMLEDGWIPQGGFLYLWHKELLKDLPLGTLKL